MTKDVSPKERSTKERFIEKQEDLYDKVFRRCYSKTSSKEVAKDLTQDIFTRTWDYINRGKDIQYINSFVYRVTSNRIKDYYKKKKSIPMANMGDFDENSVSSDDLHERIEHRAEMQRIKSRLNELGERYAEVIHMRVFEGRSPQEIGEILGERTNTVSVRIHRGLKKFRKLLEATPMRREGELLN